MAKTSTPFEHIEHRFTELGELTAAATQLIGALDHLRRDTHLRKLVTKPIFDGMAAARFYKKKAKAEAKDIEAVVHHIKQSSTPLTAAISNLRIKLTEKIKQAGRADDTTFEAFGIMAALVLDIERINSGLDESINEQANLMTFFVSHLGQVSKIVSSLPQVLYTLNSLSKKDAKAMIQEINSALKNIVLLADKLEIQFCLKEGYLVNKLRPIMMTYYKELNKLGYDFVASERYPFDVDIAKQREALLRDEHLPTYQNELIKARQRSATTLEQKDDHRAKLHTVHQKFREKLGAKFAEPDLAEKKAEELKSQMNAIVIRHIDSLNFLKKRATFIKASTEEKEIDIKIRLFEKFKHLLEQSKSPDLNAILKQLRKENPAHMYLLYEGKAAAILQKLDKLDISPNTLLKEINNELAKLKKQRGTTYYLYGMKKADILEQRINACERLQLLLKDHALSDALSELTFNEKSILEKYDAAFLKKIQSIEKAMSVEYRPKTVLGAVKPKNDSLFASSATGSSVEQTYIIQMVDDRIAELKSSFIQTEVVKNKIELLVQLKAELKPGVSLDTAINTVKSGSHKKDAHLLFEGRTGKVLKAAQHVSLTKDDLIGRLDSEINNLKQQRFGKLSVFKQQRKQVVDEHLEALQALRAEISSTDHKGKSVKEIIDGLSRQNKQTLQRYEPELVKDLHSGAQVRFR